MEDIGNKIAAVCDRKEIDYHFYVLEEKEVNAFSLPGGYAYIFKGLIDKLGTRYLKLAGYDPYAMTRFFYKVARI